LVLGGLIQDSVTNTESQVPLLGSIPIIGELFRTRNTEKTKTNFLIFLQPHILRTDEQVAEETEAKYNYMQGQQKILNHDSKIIPFQPFAPADPFPPMNQGRTKSGVLSPDINNAPSAPAPGAPADPATAVPAPPVSGTGFGPTSGMSATTIPAPRPTPAPTPTAPPDTAVVTAPDNTPSAGASK
jgi:general secretion pathway protein D